MSTTPTHDTEHLELRIAGMSCASCVQRIERKLNKLDGVSASVNFATETASVDYDAGLTEPADLTAAVKAAGYEAIAPAASPAGTDEHKEQDGGGGHHHPDASSAETAALVAGPRSAARCRCRCCCWR